MQAKIGEEPMMPNMSEQPTAAYFDRPTPPTPEQLASLLPQFEILELIGYGGMGAVYKARQRALDRIVAIKIIMPSAAGLATFEQRFAREAKALAKLSHPNIVTIHEFGQVALPNQSDNRNRSGGSIYYLVMEYVSGVNLRHWMANEDRNPAQTLAIISQICEALQYAHSVGVVHRDIKPENLLVSLIPVIQPIGSSAALDDNVLQPCDIQIKIADFGLAKISANSGDTNITKTHEVLGTLRYMAPEQLDGKDTVDHRADIYSLGVVFYELLTGNLPTGYFELPSTRASVDRRVDDVVMRSLAREPERRYQRAIEIKTDVDGIRNPDRTAQAPSAAISPSVIQPNGPALYSITLPLILLVAGVYWFTHLIWAAAGLLVPWSYSSFWFGRYPDKRGVHTPAVNLIVHLVCTAAVFGYMTYASALSQRTVVLVLAGASLLCLAAGVAFVALGKHLHTFSTLTVFEREVRKREKKDKEMLEGLQLAAFFLGAVGLFRTFSLFEFLTGEALESKGWFELCVTLTGPVVFAGAVCIANARYYRLAIVTCALCAISGNLFAILIGAFSFANLMRLEIANLFASRRVIGSTPTTVATAPIDTPHNSTFAAKLEYILQRRLGPTVRWLDHHSPGVLSGIQWAAVLIHTFCMICVLSFSSNFTQSTNEGRNHRMELGGSKPWLKISVEEKPVEKMATAENTIESPKLEFHFNPNWEDMPVTLLFIAILTLAIHFAIEVALAREKKSSFTPSAMAKLWLTALAFEIFLPLLFAGNFWLTQSQYQASQKNVKAGTAEIENSKPSHSEEVHE